MLYHVALFEHTIDSTLGSHPWSVECMCPPDLIDKLRHVNNHLPNPTLRGVESTLWNEDLRRSLHSFRFPQLISPNRTLLWPVSRNMHDCRQKFIHLASQLRHSPEQLHELIKSTANNDELHRDFELQINLINIHQLRQTRQISINRLQ